MRKFVVLLLVQVVFCFAVTGSALAERSFWLEGNESRPRVDLKIPSFAPLIRELGDAVVNISTEGEEKVALGGFAFGGPGDNLLFHLYPELRERYAKRRFSSLGSGFVVHPDGYIVTNNHVIAKATKIHIGFRDEKKTYEAQVVGRDERTDIALLKVETDRKLTSVVLGDSDALAPGDWVIAIGNPFRFGHTATLGIVSALSRRVPGAGTYSGYIQTDASINPGNSGGPLFNVKGEVVGVSTAIYSPGRTGAGTGFNIGIGFATPINLVKSVLAQLRDKGKVTRGWLGVYIQTITEDAAEALDLDSAKGALVADVAEGGPAEKSGIERGDIIVSYDGKAIDDSSDLPVLVAETKIGRKVEIVVIRGGKRKEISVTIGELVDNKSETEAKESQEENKIGASVQSLTADLAAVLGLRNTSGVIVTRVAPGSPAERAGLRRGDVIIEIASRKIKTVDDFSSAVSKITPGHPVLLLVRRGESTVFFTVKVE